MSHEIKVAFYTDPVNINDICISLEQHGVVFIQTTRTNFRAISNAVKEKVTEALPLAAKGPDGDFHYFLFYYANGNYEANITENRVLKAILAWQSAGEPIPHIECI